MGILYLPLFLLILAGAFADLRRESTSHGLVSVVLGCSTFSFGLVNLPEYDIVFCWLTIAAGLLMALLGTARFIASEVNRRG